MLLFNKNYWFYFAAANIFFFNVFAKQLWPTNVGRKRSVFIPIPKKGNAKECSDYSQLHSSHMLVKWCLKFSKPGFSNTWTVNFQMFKLGFRKGRGTRDQIANIFWIISKAREFQKKHLFLLYWLCQSLWLCGSQYTWKFWKRWEYQTTWPASWENYMQVRKQQLELDMEQQAGSK